MHSTAFARVFLVLSAVFFLSSVAHGQAWPARPIKLVVPDSPGTPIDLLARAIGVEMGKTLGQPLSAENRPGANFMVAYEYVAKKVAADGHAVVIVLAPGLAMLPATVKDLRFDPINNLMTVRDLGEQRFVLASPTSTPWRSLKDLLAKAKAEPGKLAYGSNGMLVRLTTEGVFRDAQARLNHIPFSSSSAYSEALLSGKIQVGLISEALAASSGSKLRILAVTGEQRSTVLPKVATFTEQGVFNISGPSYSLSVRSGTPQDIVDKLNAAALRALQQPAVLAQFANMKMEVIGNSPVAARARLTQQSRLFSSIARRAGIEPE